MTHPGPEDDARNRREQQQDDDAARGDGLAQATHSDQAGEGLTDDDTADGEQADQT